MDRSLQHVFAAEEIMAYLDGELEPQRAAALAAHLVGCGECQEVAKGFRAISERMLNFEVEPAPMRTSAVVLDAWKAAGAATSGDAAQLKWWNLRRLFAKRYAWALACCVAVASLVALSIPNLRRSRIAAELAAQRATGLSAPVEDQRLLYEPRPGLTQSEQTDVDSAVIGPAPGAQPAAKDKLPAVGGSFGDHAATSFSNDGQPADDELQAPEAVRPMIAQTASLSIVATNYDEASAAIERLAAGHGGYVEKLTAKAPTGSARGLSAALRIPTKQLDGFLADLRKLGHVDEESRENEEVSAQYVDLQARLKSARATEQRLIELLGTRTGKLSDVLEAERELARIRGEIESMQGQNAVLLHRVSYATVQVDLSEVYRQRLSTTSKGTKIWNALVQGFGNLEDGAVAMLIFLLAYGPSILFWLAVLTLPAWLIGRRLRRQAQA